MFAIDLPGFGASERRDDLMSPRRMGEFLGRLIDQAELGRPHIVAPDVGTSAALLAAAAHPDQFTSVTVGTGGAAVPLQLGEPLSSWVLDPDLDKYRRMDISAPVTIINGRNDRVVPIADAEFLDARLRNSKVAIIEGGHFIWEEAPEQYASIVLDAINAHSQSDCLVVQSVRDEQ